MRTYASHMIVSFSGRENTQSGYIATQIGYANPQAHTSTTNPGKKPLPEDSVGYPRGLQTTLVP